MCMLAISMVEIFDLVSSIRRTGAFGERKMSSFLCDHLCFPKDPPMYSMSHFLTLSNYSSSLSEHFASIFGGAKYFAEIWKHQIVHSKRSPTTSNGWNLSLCNGYFDNRVIAPDYCKQHELASLFTIFDSLWLLSVVKILNTWYTEINHEDCGNGTVYFCSMWDRSNCYLSMSFTFLFLDLDCCS